MGTFTVLDAGELSELASTFGLGAILSSRAIDAGTINSNFAIETASGRYFLRVNEGKSEADVAWEAQLVGALADRGVTTPKPLVARDGRPYAPLAAGLATGKWVSAFSWRAGAHLRAESVTPQHAHEFGAALAALHVAGLALPVEWRRTSIYDHDHLVQRFARIASPGFAGARTSAEGGGESIEREHDPDLAAALPILREELALAASAAEIRRAATHGIIHGDLFRDNVLWDGDRISAILDFEQASGGSLAYDVAVCLNDWCWSDRERLPRMDLVTTLLAGYQGVRPLSAGDREALPYELRASAARFTITRITDVYLAKLSNPEKDFRAFLARCEVWRSPALRALTQLL